MLIDKILDTIWHVSDLSSLIMDLWRQLACWCQNQSDGQLAVMSLMPSSTLHSPTMHRLLREIDNHERVKLQCYTRFLL